MATSELTDWGAASVAFDKIRDHVKNKDLATANEAQTRFDVIDRLIREVLGWEHGNIQVEEYAPKDEKAGFVDYILRLGDISIIIEAKRIGASFPSPTIKPKLKLNGSVLGTGEIAAAIKQAHSYAHTKEAQVVVVTNGLCWCFYSFSDANNESYASLLFPFSKDGHAEELFNLFGADNVAAGSISGITNELPPTEERLLTAFRVADDRVDRNNIADQISPALDKALYSEALLNDKEALKRCFVTTEARTKFDAMLGMHLADPKPSSVTPAKRINRDKRHDHLETFIERGEPSFAPPVTLIIGPVGAGKSTYLKHFELISGSEALSAKSAHWIYIDMEAVGKSGDPRAFIYGKLKDYLPKGVPGGLANYNKVVELAYSEEIQAMKAGPLSLIANDKVELNRIIAKKLYEDYQATEPYVDTIISYMAKKNLAVIVLDNIDLYEDDKLETAVFAEGLALSKRVFCHVIVSVRDTTFVRHKTDSAFNAYELRKLWLDPPPLKAVISARLSYSRKILEKKSTKIDLGNAMHLQVPDLSIFFDIVQQSILRGQAGDYIEAIADLDTRKGITLVKNFLTSGHIEADRALKQYLTGDTQYYFPFHEIFKGTMMGQWRHFRESRSEGVNIFDSRLGSKRLRLARCFLLQFLVQRAKMESSLEVTVKECCEVISTMGATPKQVLECITFLCQHNLVRTTTSEAATLDSSVVISRSGGYYIRILIKKFVYVEECMYDTAIDAESAWRKISDLTASILTEKNTLARMEERKKRIIFFLDALQDIEDEVIEDAHILKNFRTIPNIRESIISDVDSAIKKIKNVTRNDHNGKRPALRPQGR